MSIPGKKNKKMQKTQDYNVPGIMEEEQVGQHLEQNTRLLGSKNREAREVVSTAEFVGHFKGFCFTVHILGRFQKV